MQCPNALFSWLQIMKSWWVKVTGLEKISFWEVSDSPSNNICPWRMIFAPKLRLLIKFYLKWEGGKTHLILHYKLYFWQELNFQFHDKYLERFQTDTPIWNPPIMWQYIRSSAGFTSAKFEKHLQKQINNLDTAEEHTICYYRLKKKNYIFKN